MVSFDAATVLLQWTTGGLLFTWVTTRRRQVGIGYGWLMRGVYMALALAAGWVGLWLDPVPVREVAACATAAAAGAALWSSVRRRKAGVRGEHERQDAKRSRVSAMTGIDRRADEADRPDPTVDEFDPRLDLVAPVFGTVGLVAAALAGDGGVAVALVRTLLGAAFLGVVTDAMLLGHWYLVQPGLPRAPLLELVRWIGWLWPFEVAALLVPTGMVSVLTGTIDDGYNGLLGWFWVACAVTTIGLVFVTMAALRERYYSAVMAATGLLYLAILTGAGTDLVARALLA